ncbi:uncharacterized protein LOC126882662 [Diabrotica virgifera virgifera]|uniref:Uncharacterized protein n=1 Tax=Diabrotica virgifera virgifera TaxID=50390 RepID=A0ABM5K078_DIAVI|nr:uncharacterized protein LOC126882662 [Diabrotica virgifera virgifera]
MSSDNPMSTEHPAHDFIELFPETESVSDMGTTPVPPPSPPQSLTDDIVMEEIKGVFSHDEEIKDSEGPQPDESSIKNCNNNPGSLQENQVVMIQQIVTIPPQGTTNSLEFTNDPQLEADYDSQRFEGKKPTKRPCNSPDTERNQSDLANTIQQLMKQLEQRDKENKRVQQEFKEILEERDRENKREQQEFKDLIAELRSIIRTKDDEARRMMDQIMKLTKTVQEMTNKRTVTITKIDESPMTWEQTENEKHEESETETTVYKNKSYQKSILSKRKKREIVLTN